MLIFKGRNRVTSGYRLSDRPDHNGLDIVGDDSKDILCPVEGTVKSSTIITNKNDPTWEWGNYVRVDDKDGNRLYFCHMASRAVSVGQKVSPGTKLGVMGNTGYSFGAHTHFEVRKADNTTRLNPATYIGIPNVKGTYEDSDTMSEWVNEGNDRFKYYSNGVLQTNKWIKTDGWWYRVGSDGVMLTGYVKIGNEIFYLNKERTTVGSLYIPLGACIITDERGNIIKGW